jgi:hypothetical protein
LKSPMQTGIGLCAAEKMLLTGFSLHPFALTLRQAQRSKGIHW